MKIVADTNLLLRVIVRDDPRQAQIAQRELSTAAVVAVSLSALCETVWVLRSRYGLSNVTIAEIIRNLVTSRNVVVDQAAVEAGLAILDAGGDFADGVIDFEGRRLGGDIFVSFDKQAVSLIKAAGFDARQL